MSKIEAILKEFRNCLYDFARQFPLDEAYTKIDYDDEKDGVCFRNPMTNEIIHAQYYYNDEKVKPYRLISLNKKSYELSDNLTLELSYKGLSGYYAFPGKTPKEHDLLGIDYCIRHYGKYISGGNIYYDLGEKVDYLDLSLCQWRSKGKHYFNLSKEELRELSLDEKSIEYKINSFIKHRLKELFKDEVSNDEIKINRVRRR